MDYVRRVAEVLDVGITQLFFGIPEKDEPTRKSAGPRDPSPKADAIQRYFDFFMENSVALDRVLDLRTGFPSALSLAWEKTLGWSRPELMKIRWIELLHPDERDPMAAIVERSAAHSGSVANCEHRLLTSNGSYVRVHTKLSVDRAAQIMTSISLLIETVASIRLST